MAFVHDTFFLVAAVVGGVLGGVLGGAIAIIVIVVSVLCIWKHKKSKKQEVCLVLCIHTIHAHDNYSCFLPRLLPSMSYPKTLVHFL